MKTKNHKSGDLKGGSGSGPYTRGERIARIDQLKVGTIIICDSQQFNATNVARVAELPAGWTSPGYGVDHFYVEFRDPADVRRYRNGGSGPLCIWDFTLTHETFYLAVPERIRGMVSAA